MLHVQLWLKSHVYSDYHISRVFHWATSEQYSILITEQLFTEGEVNIGE